MFDNTINEKRLEWYKDYPEAILEIRKGIHFYCRRCEGEIPKDHGSLKECWRRWNSDPSQPPCPHCGNVGNVRRVKRHGDTYQVRAPIEYVKVRKTQYVIGKHFTKTWWGGTKLVSEDTIDIVEVISDVTRDDTVQWLNSLEEK